MMYIIPEIDCNGFEGHVYSQDSIEDREQPMISLVSGIRPVIDSSTPWGKAVLETYDNWQKGMRDSSSDQSDSDSSD